MKKYRIIGSGQKEYPYIIQQKWLFFWHLVNANRLNKWECAEYLCFRTVEEAEVYIRQLQTDVRVNV